MKRDITRQVFEKNFKYQISLKIRPEGAKLFFEDKQTDRPTARQKWLKLIVGFHNFVTAPKIREGDSKV